MAAIGITNQRETTLLVGPRDRPRAPPRHRLAGPAHRRPVRAPALRGPRGGGDGRDGPPPRPLLLGHQARLAARPRGRREGRRPRGPARLRHGGFLADLAPHRRPRPRHRPHQRLPHAPLRRSRGRVVGGHAADARHPPRPPARDPRLRRGVRRGRPRRQAGRHPRRGGRPAGRDRGPGLLRARHGQVHLRHRLLRAPQHRGGARGLARAAADHRGLPARGADHLRARGRDLRRGRGRAVAARRDGRDRERARDRLARARTRTPART